MASSLLVLIYIAFVSLGLPDSLLGSAWPIMHGTLGVPVSFAGVISMIIAGSTVVSSLLSDRMNRKFGTGLVTAGSVLLTALGLLGFSVAPSFWVLCALAVPYGLGAGAVDAALNNYVALHYSSRHMSWLHCSWGVGAALGPVIMGQFLANGGENWPLGYRTIAVLQFVLTLVLFLALPLWRKNAQANAGAADAGPAKSLPEVLRIPGVRYILLAFFGYCALELTAGLWASSYLVIHRGVDAGTAAQFASLFYIGITVGRFICGFIAGRLQDRDMIRLGLGFVALGVVLILLPLGSALPALAGLILTGLGCAPIYPSIIHATPYNFGKENSQAVIGVQMAFAYIGSTFMPPLFGLIAGHISIGLYPLYLLALGVLMFVMTEALNARNAKRAA